MVRAVRSSLKRLTKDVLIHQFRAKNIISIASLRTCQQLANETIPTILKEMETDESQALRHTFYGYFSALLCSIYGHRPGVLTNMKLEEVARAQEDGDQDHGYVICVSTSFYTQVPHQLCFTP